MPGFGRQTRHSVSRDTPTDVRNWASVRFTNGVGGDPSGRCAGAERNVRAVVRRASAPRRSPSPRGKGLCRRSGQRRHALGAGRNPRTERRAPRPLRARALPPGGAAYPARGARPGRAGVRVLRNARRHDRSCPTTVSWRAARLDERGGRLRPVQPSQRRSAARRTWLASPRRTHTATGNGGCRYGMGQTRSGVGAIPRAELGADAAGEYAAPA